MSSSKQQRPAAAPPPAPGSYIDWGPALPGEYGLTRIAALVRDPGRFFVLWEGGQAIRARDLTDGTTREHPVGRTGTWYFEGRPEHEYEVDLLLEGRVVAVSARIRLPRRDPATTVDAEWIPTPAQLELLRQLGHSLEVLMNDEVEALNSDLLRRRAGGGSWPSSSGRR